MNLNSYDLNAGPSNMIFEFISEGPNGQIPKVIEFNQINFGGLYNLGFGDKSNCLEKFDDKIVSNNGDSLKVLATIASSLYKFTEENPGCWIYAEGITPARNRLYRMGISKNLKEAIQDFEIFGFKDGKWKVFERNIDYAAFLARRKIKI